MGRRVLAFFLGMIFGMIFLLGSVALGIYLALTVISPDKYIPNASDYLGSLAELPLLDIIKELSDLYAQKAGVADANGRYFSVGEFLERYQIDTTKAFGIELPEIVLEMPMFELISEGGFDKALNQIKVSSALKLIGMFLPDAAPSDAAIAELSRHSLADLFSAEKGIGTVFQNVSIVDILPGTFPHENDGNTLMWAVGQAKIGQLYSALGANQNLFLQLTAGGSLETLGSVPVASLLGDDTGIIGRILGQAAVCDVITEDGSINVDTMLGSIYLGTILGCDRYEITDNLILDTELSTDTDKLYKRMTPPIMYAKEDNGNYYHVDLFCTDEHTHDATCYSYVWYNADGHADFADGDVYFTSDNLYHTPINGLYKAFASLQLQSMLNGSSDAITEQVKTLKITDIVGDEVSGIMREIANMTIGELMNGGVDSVYLGSLFNYKRNPYKGKIANEIEITDVFGEISYVADLGSNLYMSDNGTDWYTARIVCTDDHAHTQRNCYTYVWYMLPNSTTAPNAPKINIDGEYYVEATGMMLKLADERVSDLSNLNATIETFTLADVLGNDLRGILAELKDTQLKDVSDAIFSIYLGSVMDFNRNEIDSNSLHTYSDLVAEAADGSAEVRSDGLNFAKTDDGTKWYEAILDCGDTDHTISGHTPDCYAYVWYKEDGNQVSGITKAFVNSTLNNIDDTLSNDVKRLTLNDIGIETTGNNILSALGDVPISQIGGQINEMKLGVVLGYFRKEIEVPNDHTDLIYKDNLTKTIYMRHTDGKYYEVTLNCQNPNEHEDEQHDETCYADVWYSDLESGTLASGINGKMSNTSISALGNGGLTDVVKQLNVGDLIDSEMLNITEENAYKLDVFLDDPSSDPRCSFKGYSEYLLSHKNATFQEYFDEIHQGDQSARGYWKTLKLTDFIETLLDAF